MPSSLTNIELLIRALNEQNVRYVLVGGMAATIYGGTAVTDDCDLAISGNPEDRESMARALGPLNPRPLRYASKRPYPWDVSSLHAPFTCLMTDAGRVDVLFRLQSMDSFEGLYARSKLHRVFGCELRVASLSDLIQMKEGAGRPKDLHQLIELYEIRDLAGSDRP